MYIKMVAICDKCFKKTEVVYEVNSKYICESCLDDMNTKFDLLMDLQNGK